MLTSWYEAVLIRQRKVPTCLDCGVPVLLDATLCDECRLAGLERILMLREYLLRTIDDEKCEWPFKDRPLS
jgi:hypothetical protein